VSAKTPLLSWKKRPPESPAEAKAARLLSQLGPAPTLPPEAHARIAQKLRSGAAPRKERLTLLPPMRISVIASGLASMAIVGVLVFVMFDQKAARESLLERAPAPAATAAAPAQPPAPKDVDNLEPQAPAALFAEKPAANHGAAAHSAAKKERAPLAFKGTGSLGFGSPAAGLGRGAPEGAFAHAQPPPGWRAKTAARGAVQDLAAPFPEEELAGGGGAARKLRLQEQGPPPAPPAGPAAVAQASASAEAAPRTAPPAAAPAPMAVTKGELTADDKNDEAERREQAPACEQFAPGLDADALPAARLSEHDLIARARCRLARGDRSGARDDLDAYLARFPKGRFAREAAARRATLPP